MAKYKCIMEFTIDDETEKGAAIKEGIDALLKTIDDDWEGVEAEIKVVRL